MENNNEKNSKKIDKENPNQELTKSDIIFGYGFFIVIILVVIFLFKGCVNFVKEDFAKFNAEVEATKAENEAKHHITKEKYGEDYPFTIDNLTLKCENDAVWVEDAALNKYALNGLANTRFQGRGDYKGYTTSIEKPNPDIPGTTLGDGGMLSKGMEFCK